MEAKEKYVLEYKLWKEFHPQNSPKPEPVKHPLPAYSLWRNANKINIREDNPTFNSTEIGIKADEMWESLDSLTKLVSI